MRKQSNTFAVRLAGMILSALGLLFALGAAWALLYARVGRIEVRVAMLEDSTREIEQDVKALLYRSGTTLTAHSAPNKWMVEGIAATDDLNLNAFSLDRAVLLRGVSDLPGTAVVVDHDSACPVGRVESAWLVRDELHVRIEVSHSSSEIWDRIKDGSVARFSISVRAFRTYPGFDNDMGAVLLVKDAMFVGMCFTTRPADTRAVVTRWYEE